MNGVVTRWNADKYARGSFSYCATGGSKQDFDLLSEPLTDRNILFAGEATFGQHYGNTDAAFESGKREAQRIVELFKLNKIE